MARREVVICGTWDVNRTHWDQLIVEGCYVDGNFVVSPLNVHEALCYLEAGATPDSDYAKEMGWHLHRWGDLGLKGYQTLRLRNAVAIFGPRITKEYLQLTQLEQPEKNTVEAINGWVERKTGIRNMIGEVGEGITLVSALVVKGSWEHKFSDSSPGVFAGKPAVMMHQTNELLVNRCDERYMEVALSFESQPIYLSFILPTGTLEETMKIVADREWFFCYDVMTVTLSLPRFSIEWGTDLTETVKKIIPKAFEEQTWSVLDPTRPYQVSKILHKARLFVDEEGAEAAAATVVEMAAMMSMPIPREKITIVFDRPFICVVTHREYGPLFFGQITNLT